jgi:GNAT superfamily N-acetyltransferase
VAETARGLGVGTALLDSVVSEARQRSCVRLMLNAVRRRESYMRGFYTKRGWTEREDMANMVFEP